MYDWVQMVRTAKAILCTQKPDGCSASDVNVKSTPLLIHFDFR